MQAIRSRIDQLQKDKSRIETNLSRENEKVRRKRAEINQIKRSIYTSTPDSTRQSKQRQIEQKERELTTYEKKAADLSNQLTRRDSELLRKLSEAERVEAQIQQRKMQEDKRQRDKEIQHTRNMTMQLERQAQLHSRMSKSPITIRFEDLPQQITVLFIASNPEDQGSLRLDEEIREIQKNIKLSKHRDSVRLESIWATRPTDLLQAINEYKPTVVHFSGHGSDRDELLLQNDSGKSQAVSKKSLVEMFRVMSSDIKLIVFNTCFSGNQAAEVTDHVPASIGMSSAVGDQAARVFAAQLYSAIGFGRSIGESFEQARVALMLSNIPEEDTPQLFVSAGLDENNIFLVQPEEMIQPFV